MRISRYPWALLVHYPEEGIRNHWHEQHGNLQTTYRWPYEWVLEVHHIDPIGGVYHDRLWTIKNMPHNLRVLCVECHDEAHRLLWEAVTGKKSHVGKEIEHDPWEVARESGQLILELSLI